MKFFYQKEEMMIDLLDFRLAVDITCSSGMYSFFVFLFALR